MLQVDLQRLSPRQNVRVRYMGRVSESCPVQGTADVLLILK